MSLARLAYPLFAAILLTLNASAAAHDGPDDHEHPPRPVPEVEAHRPSPIPDRIILTLPGDPARSLAVTWRTSEEVGRGLAQIVRAEAGSAFVKSAREVTAETTTLTTDLGTARYHTVVFEGLEPATQYAYRVGDGVNWSEWFHARTAAATAEPFSFIYFGDAQTDIKSLWSRVIRGAYSEVPRARFIIHAGDLVNDGNRDAQWGEWFASGGWVNGMVPSLPSPGNHEYRREGNATEGPRRLTRHWRAQFALPGNGPEGLEETVYYVDYQGARIVSLNSNEQQERQAEWLAGVLADNPNRWTIVTFHHPIYSAARERDNPELRRLWQPVFDKYRVDLVLQGHDHAYGRSGLVVGMENVPTGASVRDPAGGTVYVVSVSGPKLYPLGRQPWMRRAAEDTQLYQIIRIEGDRLFYSAHTATGEPYDGFELIKREGRPNELIERVPPVPERRRPAAAAAAG